MGLGWETSRELIRRSIAEAREVGGDLASGAGTDHLDPTEIATLSEIKGAYEEQSAFVEGEGGRVILMASRALAARAESPTTTPKSTEPSSLRFHPPLSSTGSARCSTLH